MRRKTRPAGGKQREFRVEGLGARGDGLATYEGQPVFLAQTLPGERVLARLSGTQASGFRGEVLELLETSADRAEAPCPHFGPCGGCTLQHFAAGPYRAWKQRLVVEALSRRGFDPATTPVRPLLALAPGTRRRAAFAARRRGGRVELGFHRRQSHEIENLSTCLLLAPPLVVLLAPLRELLAVLLSDGGEAEATVLLTQAGIDLLLALPAQPDLAGREALAAFAGAADLARLTLTIGGGEPEPVAQRRPPQLDLGGIAVVPPPGGFLQPTSEGEAALTALVLEAVPAAAELLADLYSGIGTFTFPLARRGHRVHAVEGSAPALDALERAAHGAGLADQVTAERRDLERRPVTAEELEGGDAVVFDPPRAGARAQAIEIADSELAVVVAVSCNPATFARDARTLVDGGYHLDWVTPLDQFPWSGHVELVARFSR